MFDYTPVGGAVMVAGIAFVALAGRFLLPRRDPAREASSPGLLELQRQYQLDERSAVVRLPADSPLSGKTLQESRIGSSTGLMVYAILRGGRTRLAPGPDDVLQVGDRLLVAGKLARINEMRGWRELIVDEDVPGLDAVVSGEIGLAELNIAAGSALAGQTLEQVGFRLRFGGIVLAIRRGTDVTYANLGRHVLQIGDRLLVQARRTQLEALIRTPDFRDSEPVSESDLVHRYQLQKRIFTVRVPGGSALEGQSLAESRLGDAVGLGVIGLRRGETTHLLPERDEVLHGEDVLVVRGRRDDLTTFKGLQALEIESEPAPDLRELEPERVGLLEAMLSPRTSFAGKSPRQLGFRQRYGLQVMAILREGRVHRSNLRDTALRFGDALLLLGPQEKLQFVARDPEFLVLSDVPQPIADKRRAPIAVLIMAAVVLPVILGWLPISISAVSGAALMVLLRCLSMDQALLAIDWRSVFLIAGMLPLGTALQETGAAGFVAEGMLAGLGDVGPRGVLLVVCLLTAVLTSVVPTAALVVLMAPIAFKAAASAGLAPHAVMMAVAMAASASFTSPVSHPANLMVMGPGGYRFVDYVKVGVPLTLIILLVVLLVVPLCWSLEG